MKFLYIYGKQTTQDVPWTLIELGYQLQVLDKKEFDPLNPLAEDYDMIEKALTADHYDFLISQLFLPQASDVCQKLGVTYISWTYDSPLISLFTKPVFNSCNRLFIFDYAQYERLKSLSVPHVYYLPMAVNLQRTGALNISTEDEIAFSSDISFIGILYEKNTYNGTHHVLPPDVLQELNSYLEKHLCHWESRKQWPALSDSTCAFLKDELHTPLPAHPYLPDNQYLGLLLLTRKLAEMDRTTILNTLAALHSVHLYTTSSSQHLVNVDLHPKADYFTEMNKIFYLSKINLNITLPSIETGIPQRVFDIMGSGGFVLTNYQEELDMYFKPGQHLEIYHSLEELVDKTAYYLSHEEQRLRIAINGYKEIQNKHTYKHRMEQMLTTIRQEQNGD